MSDLRHGGRLAGLDVVRGVALIGVCAMNYHGYLINRGGQRGNGWTTLLDPWTGPLSTRFAATFVVVAGIGISLLTTDARRTRHPKTVMARRLTLVRRGVLLLAGGLVLDWVWPGTILFFYGGYFLVSALLITLADRWLILIGAASALSATAIRWWVMVRSDGGHETAWLLYGEAEANHSPRDLVLDLAVRGTHPLLPWLAFLTIGMVLGRRLPLAGPARATWAFGGVLAVVFGFGLEQTLGVDLVLRSTDPFDWALPYTLTAGGTAVVAVIAISALADRWPTALAVRALAVTGRSTLTLYVLHALVFNLVVDWLGWIEPGSIWNAFLLALAYWIVAVMLANAWASRHEHGPLEAAYRAFSG